MRAFVVGIVFLLGLIVGRFAQEEPKKKEPPSIDLAGEIIITPQSGVYPTPYSGSTLIFRPYMIETDGVPEHVDLLREGEEMWFIQLDGGRIQIQAVRVPR